MKTRAITGLMIVGCVIPPLVFGGILLNALVALIVVVGGFELFMLMENYKKMPPIFYLAILLACFSLLFVPEAYVLACLSLAILILFSMPVITGLLHSLDAIMMCAIFIVLFIFANAFTVIHDTNPNYIWYIIFATYVCDTGAYLVGSFFGKTKLCKRLSPNKTIEGSVGGIVFSFIISMTFAYYYLSEVSIFMLIFASLTLPVVSQIGDLSFSAIKRHFHIKDFSNIFPGHGGFLDRVDSLLYNLIYFYCLLQFIV